MVAFTRVSPVGAVLAAVASAITGLLVLGMCFAPIVHVSTLCLGSPFVLTSYPTHESVSASVGGQTEHSSKMDVDSGNLAIVGCVAALLWSACVFSVQLYIAIRGKNRSGIAVPATVLLHTLSYGPLLLVFADRVWYTTPHAFKQASLRLTPLCTGTTYGTVPMAGFFLSVLVCVIQTVVIVIVGIIWLCTPKTEAPVEENMNGPLTEVGPATPYVPMHGGQQVAGQVGGAQMMYVPQQPQHLGGQPVMYAVPAQQPGVAGHPAAQQFAVPGPPPGQYPVVLPNGQQVALVQAHPQPHMYQPQPSSPSHQQQFVPAGAQVIPAAVVAAPSPSSVPGSGNGVNGAVSGAEAASGQQVAAVGDDDRRRRAAAMEGAQGPNATSRLFLDHASPRYEPPAVPAQSGPLPYDDA